MAAPSRRANHAVRRSAPWTLESLPPRSVAARLFKQFFQFDFFQAVRILEQLEEMPKRTKIVSRRAARVGHPQDTVCVQLKRRDPR